MAIPTKLRDWLFRWQSDGVQPVTLGQRRIFILPTRAGILYAIALILMLLGAINYSLGLGHALVFLLAGLGLTGMVHTFRNLYALQLSPGRADPVFAGEPAHFPLHLSHDRLNPRLGLEFRVEKNPVVVYDLAPRGHGTIALPVLAEHRGWLELPRIRLSTTYPLGLFIAWAYPSPAMRCLVYPKPLIFPLPPATSSVLAGLRQGDGGRDDFAGLRERNAADSPRHVAWKAAARDGERPLQVKQFAGGAQTELWLDWDLLPPSISAEEKLSALCGWVIQADALGVRYGLRFPGIEIPPDDSSAHRLSCFERLALASI